MGNHNTITFTAGLPGTVTLTNGTLSLTRSVTIDGTGATIAVDGNHAVHVFTVNSGVTAAITALTIQHGNDVIGGGIINNDGALTVTNSTVAANSANIQRRRHLQQQRRRHRTVTNSTFAGNPHWRTRRRLSTPTAAVR